MKFDGSKAAFGRHETFALRYSWIPKGFHHIDAFESEDAVVKLGVGKNMVNSIRYWLRASQLITEVKPDNAKTIGTLIFDVRNGYDRYLEDEGTIWLVHWLLATNPSLATSWFWFFNKFHKPEFTTQELQTALNDFVKDQVNANKRPVSSTLKSDAQLIPRMYAQSKGNTKIPLEESLDSPLSLLGLITKTAGSKVFQSKPQARPGLPIGVFSFAIAQLMEMRKLKSIPVDELMYCRNDYAAPGSIFRLTETDLITKLEKMISYIPGAFAIRETAGIHQLYQTSTIDPFDYLHKHYETTAKGIAA